MNFSTERTDCLWWLMISPDENAVRLVLSVLDASELENRYLQNGSRRAGPAESGAVGTPRSPMPGECWPWKSFRKSFEKTPVTGTSTASLAGRIQTLEWSASPKGKTLSFPWPAQKSDSDAPHGRNRPALGDGQQPCRDTAQRAALERIQNQKNY